VTLSDPEQLMRVADADVESRDGPVVRLRFERDRISAEQLIRQVTERYGVTDLSIEEPELESIIRRIYREGYDPDADPRTVRTP
jgi:ABC-2 type transport system ATP-binding protein